jgi:hypothetical protein
VIEGSLLIAEIGDLPTIEHKFTPSTRLAMKAFFDKEGAHRKLWSLHASSTIPSEIGQAQAGLAINRGRGADAYPLPSPLRASISVVKPTSWRTGWRDEAPQNWLLRLRSISKNDCIALLSTVSIHASAYFLETKYSYDLQPCKWNNSKPYSQGEAGGAPASSGDLG